MAQCYNHFKEFRKLCENYRLSYGNDLDVLPQDEYDFNVLLFQYYNKVIKHLGQMNKKRKHFVMERYRRNEFEIILTENEERELNKLEANLQQAEKEYKALIAFVEEEKKFLYIFKDSHMNEIDELKSCNSLAQQMKNIILWNDISSTIDDIDYIWWNDLIDSDNE